VHGMSVSVQVCTQYGEIFVTEYEKRVLFAQNVKSCYGLVKFAHLIENAL
jgi:hypothetical protein